MKQVVIAAASNIDHIKIGENISKEFLNGASIYAGFASAEQAETEVITCIGSEKAYEDIIKRLKTYRNKNIPDFHIIRINEGKSFKQTFEIVDGKLEVTHKDYGNYNDWAPEIPEFKTDTLLLGTANPVFQKCVLDSCTQANHILLDSKLIHFLIRADKVDELIKKVDTLFGTREEIEQLLKNCELPVTMTSSIFRKYPNLQVIIEKSAEKGGRVFKSDGTLYTYQPVQPVNELCTDGAGDVFAGVYASLLSEGKDLKEIIRSSAEIAAESVKYFGINKVKHGIEQISPEIKIIIEESRWKSRNEQSKEDPNRSH